MVFDRDRIKAKAAELAAKGVFIGTSSWKYEGWFGQLYTPARYEYRGKVAKTRFQRDCLGEYAEVFKTVCVDAAYYDFPRREYLQGLADRVPEDFQFGLKVTDAITIKKFPNLDRFGAKARQPNADFLNADLSATSCVGLRGRAESIETRRRRGAASRNGDHHSEQEQICNALCHHFASPVLPRRSASGWRSR